MSVNAQQRGTWARSILAPRERLLPGLGYRLGRHPRLTAAILVGLRRIPGRTVRTAAYRNVSRPLVERMTSKLVVPVTGGARMMVDTSDLLGRVLATSGVWEPHVTSAFTRMLAPGDVCVDVGAHVGYYTLLASKLVGPTGRVYALEPNVATHRALCSNLALNAVTNVTALRVAAGASDGRALLADPPAGNTGESAIRRVELTSSELASSTGTAVSVREVGSLLEAPDIGRVRLLKIDVEGFEADTLLGLEPLFQSGGRPALIVELHPRGVEDAVKLLGHLSATYALTAYEQVRNPSRERFAHVAPPREIVELSELIALCTRRTVNVLLTPGDGPFASR